MLIWTLVKPLVTWSQAERERRLFHVCVQVQSALITRYPGYQTASVHTIPEALEGEVKAMLAEILSAYEVGRWRTS
jgi:hypothetical protein